MEAITQVNEILKFGLDGVLVMSLLMVWRAYQCEIRSHREDLLRFIKPEEKAAA